MRGSDGTVDLPNGESLYYRSRETGEVPVVLLHGNMSSSRHWDVVFDRMDESYSLFAPDLRGYGRSSYEAPIDCVGDLAADVGFFVDYLGLDGFHCWGWSSGSAVAMQLAVTDDRVDRLVLMGPPSPSGSPVYPRTETDSAGGEPLTTKAGLRGEQSPLMPSRKAILEDDAETMREIWSKLVFVNGNPEPERFDAYVAATLRQRNLLDVAFALVHFDVSPPDEDADVDGRTVADVDAPTLVLRGKTTTSSARRWPGTPPRRSRTPSASRWPTVLTPRRSTPRTGC